MSAVTAPTARRPRPAGVVVSPSLFAADQLALVEAARKVERGGGKAIHVDVMDGSFVPKISVGTPIVGSLREHTDLFLDVHLQTEAPERHLVTLAEAGADLITVHVEATRHLHRVLQEVRATGVLAGVAFNPGTPLDAIEEVCDLIDFVWVMTHNPATLGFIESKLAKVARARELLDANGGGEVTIAVDGGVGAANAGELVAAGAKWLVAGAGVFADPKDVAGALGALQEAADGA